MRQEQIGPLQLMVFNFDKPNFEGKIADEIKRLHDNDVLRLVDGLAIQKDRQGNITVLETSQLTSDEATDYGAVIGRMIGLGSGDRETADRMATHMSAEFHARYEYGLNEDDVKDIAGSIPNGSAAMFVLIEHIWARPLRDAVRSAGGILIAQDFLTPEALKAQGRALSSSTTNATNRGV